MSSLVNNHKNNLQKITFHKVKTENLFAVESLIQSIKDFTNVSHLEFDECCPRFTDKLFSHFASRKQDIKFLQSV